MVFPSRSLVIAFLTLLVVGLAAQSHAPIQPKREPIHYIYLNILYIHG